MSWTRCCLSRRASECQDGIVAKGTPECKREDRMNEVGSHTAAFLT